MQNEYSVPTLVVSNLYITHYCLFPIRCISKSISQEKAKTIATASTGDKVVRSTQAEQDEDDETITELLAITHLTLDQSGLTDLGDALGMQ